MSASCKNSDYFTGLQLAAVCNRRYNPDPPPPLTDMRFSVLIKLFKVFYVFVLLFFFNQLSFYRCRNRIEPKWPRETSFTQSRSTWSQLKTVVGAFILFAAGSWDVCRPPNHSVRVWWHHGVRWHMLALWRPVSRGEAGGEQRGRVRDREE